MAILIFTDWKSHQVWRASAIVLNIRYRIPGKEWSWSFEVEQGPNKYSQQKQAEGQLGNARARIGLSRLLWTGWRTCRFCKRYEKLSDGRLHGVKYEGSFNILLLSSNMANSVGIAAMVWKIGESWFDSLRQRETYLHGNVETGSRALPVSYSMSTAGSLSGDKAAWTWTLISIYNLS